MRENKLWMLHSFDKDRCRHEINGLTAVLHCHHFASLTTQMAIDCKLLDAGKLLAECSEDTFYRVLTNYYRQHNITELFDRIDIAEKYFAEVGLGKMEVRYAGPYSGEIVLSHSHVDEGWIKKWGKYDKPINFIGCGYATAVFSAIYDRARREYTANETKSIVCGDEESIIEVVEAIGTGGAYNGN